MKIANVVAPGITLEEYESGQAKPINLFERRIKDWILGFADCLAHEHGRKEDAGIAVLLLASSVLEPLGGVLASKIVRTSEAKFADGFLRTFGDVPGAKDCRRLGERVCELLRNGLFHEGFIKAGLVLTSQEMPIQEKDGIIYIDPVRFLEFVDAAFSEVCEHIRNAKPGDPNREAFYAYWNHKQTEHAMKVEHIVWPGAASPLPFATTTLTPATKDSLIRATNALTLPDAQQLSRKK